MYVELLINENKEFKKLMINSTFLKNNLKSIVIQCDWVIVQVLVYYDISVLYSSEIINLYIKHQYLIAALILL